MIATTLRNEKIFDIIFFGYSSINFYKVLFLAKYPIQVFHYTKKFYVVVSIHYPLKYSPPMEKTYSSSAKETLDRKFGSGGRMN